MTISRRELLIVSTAAACLPAAAGAQDKEFWLVPADAKLDPEALSEAPPSAAHRARQNAPPGPQILVEAPRLAGDVLHSPIDIRVKFLPARGAVAPESLRVSVRLLVGWIDVTSEIRKHATITASGVSVAGAQLPKGDHRIRVEISDTTGGKSSSEAAFKIT